MTSLIWSSSNNLLSVPSLPSTNILVIIIYDFGYSQLIPKKVLLLIILIWILILIYLIIKTGIICWVHILLISVIISLIRNHFIRRYIPTSFSQLGNGSRLEHLSPACKDVLNLSTNKHCDSILVFWNNLVVSISKHN